MPAATITSFSPQGWAGNPQTITINGTNFNSNYAANTVKVSGVSAVVTGGSTTQLTVIDPKPNGNGTNGYITVDNGAGSGVGTSSTMYLYLMTITSISPTSVDVGTPITITGTNFTPASKVNPYAGSSFTQTSNSPTQIVAIVDVANGVVATHIVVENEISQSVVSSQTLTWIPTAPTITGMSTNTGPNGTVVTITGTKLKQGYNPTFGLAQFSGGQINISAYDPNGTFITGTMNAVAGLGSPVSLYVKTAFGTSNHVLWNFPCKLPLKLGHSKVSFSVEKQK